MNYFIHEKAICESKFIGEKTRIWAFSHVLPEAKIGKNCNIGEGVFIENKVVIGNGCTIKNSVAIWDCVTLDDGVFIGPSVVFTNDDHLLAPNRLYSGSGRCGRGGHGKMRESLLFRRPSIKRIRTDGSDGGYPIVKAAWDQGSL